MQTLLGVDLPWGDRAKNRFAWAHLALDGRVLDLQWGRTDAQFFDYLASETPESLVAVLLDIPIHGLPWALGNAEHFRPVDRALQAAGIPLYPLRHHGRQGSALAEEVRRAAGREDLLVIEVYPFATLRALSLAPSPLKGEGRDGGETPRWHRSSELDEEFHLRQVEGLRPHLNSLPSRERKHRGETPRSAPRLKRSGWPRYKRGPKLERMDGLAQVWDLLRDPGGLILDGTIFPALTPTAPLTAFDRAADAYDACLAALPGLYWLRPTASSCACLAGDEEHGQLLLMAQTSLVARLRQQQVPVRFSGQGGPS